MDMPVNHFKRALAEGRPQIGLWSSLCNSIAAEVIAGCGFDWIVLDGEHAPNDISTLVPQLQAFNASPTTPVVRAAWNDMVLFKRILDIGAQTILVPYVQNAEEARRAVAATRYPPVGVRGVATSMRASRFGRVKDYFSLVQNEICLLVQAETREALKNLEAIASVDGVDGVFLGPADLAADMGHLGQTRHAEVFAAFADALKRLKAVGKPAGTLTPNDADAQKFLDDGFTFVAVGSDVGLLARGGEALAQRFKK